MKNAMILALVAIMLFGVVACTQPAAAADVLQSDKPRITSPSVGGADMATLVEGNSEFAFDLYQILKDKDGNIFYSPYSISLALAMTYAGARSDTEDEMADALNFLLARENLHPAFNALDLELASRGEEAKGKDDEGFRLHVVNAVWGQRDFPFLSEYLDLLAANYGAGLRVLNFIEAPEESRVTINDWVSEQTEERIQDLIPQGAINELTRLVLTNAIYFNAAWLHQFEEDATSEGDFYLLDGSTVKVPMMRQTETFGYMEGDGYQAIELLYDGEELSTVILLPEEGEFTAFEGSLSRQLVDSVIEGIGNKRVDLSMPKFEFDSSFGLKQALASLGMEKAFIPEEADFSGMDGRRDLFIQDVLHKAFVSVDEAGTEAAAASAVIIGLTSMPPEAIRVGIDRPFIFLIRDIETGTVLFVGRVLDPAM